MDGVSKDGLYFRLTISRKRLVARPKIENFSITPCPTASGAKDFTSLKPGNENSLFWSWNSKRLSIHLFVWDFEIALEPLDNRMTGVADPNPLLLPGLAPN